MYHFDAIFAFLSTFTVIFPDFCFTGAYGVSDGDTAMFCFGFAICCLLFIIILVFLAANALIL